MADRRADEASIVPRRSLGGSGSSSSGENPGGDSGDGERPILPPPPRSLRQRKPRPERTRRTKGEKVRAVKAESAPTSRPEKMPLSPTPRPSHTPRQARLRVVQVDPWSVTKTAFLLSIAVGVVTIVAVAIVWTVLGAAGLWDSINSAIQETLGDTSTPFDITDYVGTSRVLGFTMIVAVVDVILITMIATLGAFLYNLSATLLGGVELTLAEDD